MTSDTPADVLARRRQLMLVTSVQILRIREGRIVLFRDFADPRIFEEVMGNSRAGS